MNTIDKRSAELFIKDTDELQDGMFAFLSQAKHVLDMCVHFGETITEDGRAVDFSIYEIQVYKMKEDSWARDEFMNFSCMRGSKTSIYDEFNCIDTYYFDSALNAHLAFAELAAKLNHF